MARTLIRKLVGIVTICLLAVSGVTAFAPVQKVRADYPGGDCDANAVIRCGVNSLGELKDDYDTNQGGNVKAVFKYFGMDSKSDFDGMVKGKVTKSGEVWVGSKKVATGAITAGRHNMPGSTPILNGQFYQRSPSVSFRSDSLEAFVKMDGGTFRYAVILSCGNPVKAKPVEQPKPKPKPAKPGLELKKQVRVLGTSQWRDQVTADPGDELQYVITVKNTGETDLKNVRVRDSLPQGVSFESGKLDIAPTPNDYDFTLSQFVGEGINLGTMRKGEIRQIFFTVTVGDETDTVDTDEDAPSDEACRTLRNVAHAKADNVPEEEDEALAKVCQPEEEEERPAPQVKAEQTPPAEELPVTGAAGVLSAFSITSFLGFAAYKLKEFYSLFL